MPYICAVLTNSAIDVKEKTLSNKWIIDLTWDLLWSYSNDTNSSEACKEQLRGEVWLQNTQRFHHQIRIRKDCEGKWHHHHEKALQSLGNTNALPRIHVFPNSRKCFKAIIILPPSQHLDCEQTWYKIWKSFLKTAFAMSSSQPFLHSSSSTHRTKSKFTYKHLAQLASSSISCPLRVIAHVDLDAFYAQCEMVRLGLPEDQPLAVQQWYISWNPPPKVTFACGNSLLIVLFVSYSGKD